MGWIITYRRFRGISIILSTWVDLVIKLPPLVHPDLCETRVVVVDDLAGAAGERVRCRLAEHVPNMRASDDEQRAAGHPDLWGEEEIRHMPPCSRDKTNTTTYSRPADSFLHSSTHSYTHSYNHSCTHSYTSSQTTMHVPKIHTFSFKHIPVK